MILINPGVDLPFWFAGITGSYVYPSELQKPFPGREPFRLKNFFYQVHRFIKNIMSQIRFHLYILVAKQAMLFTSRGLSIN